MKVYWIYLNIILLLWYNSTDLILVLTQLYQEQKYTGIVTIILCTYLSGTKIYCQEQKYLGAYYKTISCYTETINWFWHELMDTTLTQNATTICVVVANKKISLLKCFLCVFSTNQKYMVYWNWLQLRRVPINIFWLI